MSLISKPFDDSGVEMVDDIARYGTAISERLELFRARHRAHRKPSNDGSGIAFAMAICDAMSDIIKRSNQESYRDAYARAANTLFFECTSPAQLADPLPPESFQQSPELIQAVNDILADDELLSADGSVALQTVLMAMVWSALTFALESLPAGEARSCVRKRIANEPMKYARH